MQSSQFSNLQLFTLFCFIFFFIYLLIVFLPLTPIGCATASVGGYVPAFFPLGFWVFVSGSTHDQLSLSDFILDYLYIGLFLRH